MTTRPHRRTRLAVIGAVLIALAGCSAAPDEAEEIPELPLDAFLQEMESYRDSPDTEWTRIEELTAQCMTEQGFQYTPTPVPETIASAEPLDLDHGTPEYAAQYGYGLFTFQPVANSELVDTDPNMIMVSALSWAEQQQWTTALWGEPPPDDEPPATQNMTVLDGSERGAENRGCRGRAERAYDEEATGLPAEDLATLTGLIDDVTSAIESHPRLTDLNARWSECMTEAGHPGLAAVGDPEQALVAELDAAIGEIAPGGGRLRSGSADVRRAGRRGPGRGRRARDRRGHRGRAVPSGHRVRAGAAGDHRRAAAGVRRRPRRGAPGVARDNDRDAVMTRRCGHAREFERATR